MKNVYLICIIGLTLYVSDAFAERYWTEYLIDWRVMINNGVVYITAPNMPTHCAYSRAQISTASSTVGFSQQNNKDLYAYVLSASILEKKLRIVVDRAESECVLSGAEAMP